MDLEDLVTFVPKVGSGDYLARTKNGKQRGYGLRKSILNFTLDFVRRLNILDATKLFLSELFEVSLNLKVKYVFLRFYNSESESRGLSWHVDGSLATIIITMPSPAFSPENDSHIEVIDPSLVPDNFFSLTTLLGRKRSRITIIAC